ncbi:cell division protein ZapE [Gordonia sp. OPL2]|nr:cell division protein ZapE [Gordonia sp. OPL2]
MSLDPGQRQLAGRLADLDPHLSHWSSKRTPTSNGLFVHGPAGRGKSWLANAYFDAVPTHRKTRVHFHSFFDELHRHIHHHRDEDRAVQKALDEVIRDCRLLFFDELHVHDSGDARLLTRLLERVFARRIVVVATSNYAPDDLLPNPIWHHIFEPGIALINAHMSTFHLTGSIDYRTAGGGRISGFAAGDWTTDPVTMPKRYDGTSLAVRDRHFPVLAARPGELWVTFAQVCSAPMSNIEYLEWARTYSHWVVVDIPLFDDIDAEAQQRFINLIDVLVDIDVRVTFHSSHTLHRFSAAASRRPDAFRMQSRMQLLGVVNRLT